MTDTTSAAPSDAEIDALDDQFRWDTAQGRRDYARAVLAKWGPPPAVAGEPVAWQQGFLTTMNQDPYPALGGWFVQFWEGADVAARVYGNDAETLRRRCAAITTPQPTQAQAGAVPLTDEQIRAMCKESWVFETAKQWVRITERAHGIGIKKGDNHGLPT